MPNQKESPKSCWEINPQDKLMLAYHDTEWGKPCHDDTYFFEMLVLEGAQAGLSWQTVLNKRENYRQAFADFDVTKIAKYNQNKVEKLLLNSGLIRNRLKIQSVIKNAKVFIEIQKEFGSFDNYIWNFSDNKIIKNNWQKRADIPTSTPLSDKISRDLKKRGMSFVGSTIIYAFIQAVGIVNDHLPSCRKNW